MTYLKLENVSDSEKTIEILESTKKGLGFVPNMYVKLGKNTALLDAYSYSYHSFRDNAGFTPVEQEVIFLSVAYENNCEYCMGAHSFVADSMSGVPKDKTDAIRSGKKISDNKLASLSELTRKLTKRRGNVSANDLKHFFEMGYSESHVLGVIAGIAVKTMSNYSNHLTNPSLDEVFAKRIWKKKDSYTEM